MVPLFANLAGGQDVGRFCVMARQNRAQHPVRLTRHANLSGEHVTQRSGSEVEHISLDTHRGYAIREEREVTFDFHANSPVVPVLPPVTSHADADCTGSLLILTKAAGDFFTISEACTRKSQAVTQ